MKTIFSFFMSLVFISINVSAQNTVNFGSNKQAGKYADINDIKIYYEIYGNGEPLLLLHGNGGSIENFMFQIPEFAKYFKVIAVDSRAQGRTSDSEKEISYSSMASDMAALIDKLNLGSVYVVGWSDGGNIGLELAYAHPEKVKKLVTFGANFTFENYIAAPDSVVMNPNDPIIVQTKLLRQGYKDGAERLSPNPERLPLIKKKLADLTEKYPNFTPEQLGKIKTPTLVVAGDHDLINLNHTAKLFASLPHAELFVIPGATHLAPVEQPDLVNRMVIKFLKTPYRDIDGYYFFK